MMGRTPLNHLDDVTPMSELDMVRQDRDAQFAHNSSLLERIKELEADNEMYGEVLGRLQGILDGSGSTGVIKWNALEPLATTAKAAEAELARLRSEIEQVAKENEELKKELARVVGHPDSIVALPQGTNEP